MMRRLVVVALLAVLAFEIKAIYSVRRAVGCPAYAEPMASCAESLPRVFETGALRFSYPDGWNAATKIDERAGVEEVFLTPQAGKPGQVILILQDNGAGGIHRMAAGAESLSDPQSPSGGASTWVPGTNKTFDLGGGRQVSGYLGRQEQSGGKGEDSWMLFLWDDKNRMLAVSGPKMPDSFWASGRAENAKLNCVFWSIVRTLTPK